MKKRFKQYLSPTFLGLLLLSICMWYLTKLSYTYTAEIPVKVSVDGYVFKVECLVEAEGYKILRQRLFARPVVEVSVKDLTLRPSESVEGAYSIDPYSLQRVIATRSYQINKVVSINSIPEIELSAEL